MRSSTLLAFLLPALLSFSATFLSAADVEIHCGERSEAPGRLADLAFDTERGYGYVGGIVGEAAGAPIRSDSSVSSGAETIRWREGEFRYSLRRPNGRASVELSFVETDTNVPGLREFDVLAEGEVVLSGVDIAREAGDFAWLARRFEVSVDDGWLDIEFRPRAERWPPRLSGLRVGDTAPGAAGDSHPRPALVGTSAIAANRLEWPGIDGASGYGVFRALAPGGPFSSLTERPVRLSEYIDRRAREDREYVYKIRAYYPSGDQGPWSNSLSLRSSPVPSTLKRYNVVVHEAERRRVASAAVVEGGLGIESEVGELEFHGRRFPARFERDGGPAGRARKSVRIDMRRDTFRIFRKRREIRLSADDRDFTQLRRLLAARSEASVGLACPLVEPVAYFENGTFRGLRLDVESLGSTFRKRARLDREGVLARWTRFDEWRTDWSVYGERVGEGGDVFALQGLVQEVHRLHEGEIEEFFERRFYLDRLVDRLAVGALRGELDAPASSDYFLRDSRNGRWEFFRQDYQGGDWGIVDDALELRDVTVDEVTLARVLYPRAQRAGQPKRSEASALLSRFFAQRALRERYLRRVLELSENELSPSAFCELGRADLRFRS